MRMRRILPCKLHHPYAAESELLGAYGWPEQWLEPAQRTNVDIVIHSYRHRLGLAPGHAQYDHVELADQPPITVPTITLDGQADGNLPATDGTASAAHFTGSRTHRQVPNAGHNLPQKTLKLPPKQSLISGPPVEDSRRRYGLLDEGYYARPRGGPFVRT